MENTKHLTAGYQPGLANQIAKTVPGMAHFAGTGPAGKTCSQCQHYGYKRALYSEAGDFTRTKSRNAACGKYYELTTKHGPTVPRRTAACRHFEPVPK